MSDRRNQGPKGGFLARLAGEDAIAGLMFVGIGAFGLWIGQDYPVGTAVRMGPGYVPRALCFILLGLGAMIVVSALTSPAARSEAPPFRLAPLVLIPLAVVAFALALPRLGLVIATGLLIVLSALADKGQRPIEIALALIALIMLTVAVFVWGVGIPLRLWPEF